DSLIFASYPVFQLLPDRLGRIEQEVATKEVAELLGAWSDRVEVRGVYSTAAFRADADLMFWLIAPSADDHQRLLIEFRRTMLGRALRQTHAFLGLVRPAEFSKDHLPAFVQGKSPKRYACVYPFVRTPEWYLLEPSRRAELLREHGGGGREYPDVLANTTSAFGLGDYEWILTFEADSLDRIVELIRRLRAAEARLYTALEVPFVTGIRKTLEETVSDLF
ncbi:MAG: chlorite dismutase family protein, partial [Actinobacteria bacterium]|nr:chlorite dismutase family protein [Actinomycetota bacterium]